MTYLLDSHAILWGLIEPEKLGSNARETMENRRHSVCASAVNLWEISLKYGIGKLELHGITPEELPDALNRMGIELLDLTAAEAASFHTLPRALHKDPFDRMLSWQAIQRKMCLVSCDTALDVFEPYGLRRIW